MRSVLFYLIATSAVVVLVAAGPTIASAKFTLEEATIADVHRAFKSGELTAKKLVEMYLKRIEAYDQKGPKLNAVIYVNPKALEEAAALDAKFKKSGPVGPLHGIPVLLKDNVNTKDMPTTGGSQEPRGLRPPEGCHHHKAAARRGRHHHRQGEPARVCRVGRVGKLHAGPDPEPL